MTRDEATALLAERGVLPTAQRIDIALLTLARPQHLSAEQIIASIRANGLRISKATVYNTLEALCKAGLARQMPTTNGCCRYDADTTEHLHVRFRENSEIRDVPPDLGRRLLDNLPANVLADIESRMGIKIDGVNIQLLGVHRACSADSD